MEKSTKKNKTKFLWSHHTFKEFLDACLLELRKGNRPGTHFNRAGWENIVKTMQEKTGVTFEQKQLKNKWDGMKKEWKLYDRLMRLETGIGGTRSSIDASPEWWDEKIKVDKDFAKFMSAEIIKPAANYNDDVPAYILDNPRYYPMFKDCIGAIDGTHVRASVRLSEQPKYIGRKGYATQNIMAVCDFNMCFTFVWAGWEGTAHDTRIFNEALQRPALKFPHPTGDKYYVVDAGYPNTTGYLAPYKGANIRYHIPDFRRGQTSAMRAPRGAKETFNYMHSSLRNIIERTFGVWKARWALLRDMHVNYTYNHQVSIVLASMAIHNFIRKAGRFDEAFNTAQQESYTPIEDGATNEDAEDVPATNRTGDDAMLMAAIRDDIAQQVLDSYV